ncbi:MAG: RNA polymerase sigma factor [Candidatus Bipolaricaulaceae bacterium]
MDDAELLFRISRGDEGSFKKFYERFAPRVFRYALTLVRDRYLAEEVVQETMVTVWKSAKNFRGHSQVSTWVFGIARNHARSLLRRAPEIAEEPEGLEERGAEPVDQGERVRKALEKLPALEREVVVLAFYQGVSYREIAEILGIPEGTVKSRMFRARKHLRELLGLESPGPGERGDDAEV